MLRKFLTMSEPGKSSAKSPARQTDMQKKAPPASCEGSHKEKNEALSAHDEVCDADAQSGHIGDQEQNAEVDGQQRQQCDDTVR